MATNKNRKENLKGMKGEELEKKLGDLSETLRAIRFKAEGSKSKNVKESASLKRQIAQIMTVLQQIKA